MRQHGLTASLTASERIAPLTSMPSTVMIPLLNPKDACATAANTDASTERLVREIMATTVAAR